MTKKILNRSEFLELSQEEQLKILQKHGVYVGKRLLKNQTVILFQLAGFYVEVYYWEYRKDVDKIITTDHPEILAPYLDQIHIRDLDRNRKKDE